MTKNEVRTEMVNACQRLAHSGGKVSKARWKREMDAIYALFDKLSEEDQRAVDLEPLVMMDPALTR